MLGLFLPFRRDHSCSRSAAINELCLRPAAIVPVISITAGFERLLEKTSICRRRAITQGHVVYNRGTKPE